MTDTALCHDRYGYSFLNTLYHLWIAHARNATSCTDVGRNTFERHYCTGTSGLSNLCLLGSSNVHDDTALEHLCKVAVKFLSVFFHRNCVL